MPGDFVGGPAQSLTNLGITGFVVRVLSRVSFGPRRRPLQYFSELLDFLLERVDLNRGMGYFLF